MARMNPAADPGTAIKEGLYVPPPGRTVAAELAMRLELEPTSTHLVLGGIGTGKTSELLEASRRLEASVVEAGDQIQYCDVSQWHDLRSESLQGVLVAIAGMSVAERCQESQFDSFTKHAWDADRALREHARGTRVYPEDFPPDNEPPSDEGLYVPGALINPSSSIPDQLTALIPHFKTLMALCPGEGKHVIFLFDSLDRLPSPERFREAVEQDLRLLKAAGIGVAVVGPIRFMAGTDRAIADLFDHTHFRLATDPASPEGFAFLKEVLRRREATDLLPDACLDPIARASGGVMRDLIALAKRAGEEAYASGHEHITREDVGRAVDAFGRSLAIGLDDEQVKILRHVHRTGGFVIRGERELSLLETRRVLLYEGNRWVVHPTLAPLLDAMPEAAA